jgi:hypothetical protein
MIILNFSGSSCEGEIVSGGGSRGLLGSTWGAEESSVQKKVEVLKEICDKFSLKLEVVE